MLTVVRSYQIADVQYVPVKEVNGCNSWKADVYLGKP